MRLVKKCLALILVVAVAVVYVPSTAFAAEDEQKSWTRAYEAVEAGDVVWKGEKIASMYNQEETPVTLESVIYEDPEHKILYDSYENVEQSVTGGLDGELYLYAPTNIVIDEVKLTETKDSVTITYIGTVIDCSSNTKQMKGDTVSKGKSVSVAYNGEPGTALEIQVKYFEDKKHEILSETYASETIRLEAGDNKKFTVPVNVLLDKVNYNYDNPDCAVLEYVFSVKRYELGYVSEWDYYSSYKVNVSNLMEKDLVVASRVYEDKELTRLIDSDGDGFTNSFVIAAKGKKKCSLLENATGSYVLKEVQDYTNDPENPQLIYVFYDAFDDISEQGRNDYDEFCNIMESRLDPFEGETYTVKIADPDSLGIDEWTKEKAMEFAASDKGLHLYFGLDANNLINGQWVEFEKTYFSDAAMTKRVSIENLKAGQTYYLNMGYGDAGGSTIEGVPVRYHFEMDEPCKITFEFVSTDDHDAEIRQIKENLNDNLGQIVVTYDDLAWLNMQLIYGERLYLPSASKTGGSIIKVKNPELFERLTDGTQLDLGIAFGFAGDVGRYNARTLGEINFYVDDVLYYSGYDNCEVKIDMNSILFVPEGTENYASKAEERINAYLDSDSCSVEVEKLSPEGLTGMLDVDYDGSAPAGTEATYLTENGSFAFYSDPQKTTEEYFLGTMGVLWESIIESYGMKEEGSLDYCDGNNLGTIPVYKISINDQSRDEVKSYICFIAEGTEEQMREPYADWQDAETEIITQGVNGQIPIDAYTKIRVIKNGNEIKLIQNKEGKNKKVHAYNINAFTNFKDGKLEDLGDGKMKVMIPLGELNSDTVKAHYVDNEGNVYDLDITIETHDGKEYVCFITNHFSVYALSGDTDTVDQQGGTTDDGDNTPTDQDNGDEGPATGDTSDMTIWFVVAFLALAVAVLAVKRKRIA